jgi:hypothetical protein
MSELIIVMTGKIPYVVAKARKSGRNAMSSRNMLITLTVMELSLSSAVSNEYEALLAFIMTLSTRGNEETGRSALQSQSIILRM